MIEHINLHPSYFATAEAILVHILPLLTTSNTQKYCIVISGESGSGKTTTATCIAQLLQQQGINSAILHQDDYFYLPPATNRLHRAKNINVVGTQEVDLAKIDSHIALFKANTPTLTKSLCIYEDNVFITETLNFANVQVLLVEGTYTTTLRNADYRVFMSRTYHQTLEQRIARGRDTFDTMLNKVLDIEHQIIKTHAAQADLCVNIDYSITLQPKK